MLQDWADVTSNCHLPCISGQDTDCPDEMICFAFTSCRPAPKPTPPPTPDPTQSPLPYPTKSPIEAQPTPSPSIEPSEWQTTASPVATTASPVATTEKLALSPTPLPTDAPINQPTGYPTELFGSVILTNSPTLRPTLDYFIEELDKTEIPESSSPTVRPTLDSTKDSTGTTPPAPSPGASLLAPAPELIANVGSILAAKVVKSGITNEVLLSLDSQTGVESPTQLYQYDGFLSAIGVYTKGHMGSSFFYLGNNSSIVAYGLVNAAIETVKFDACDEISWEKDVFGHYPIR